MLSTKYKILYPVDFSKRSTLATQQVKVWVEHFRAVLDTLHIVDNNTSGPLTNLHDPALYQEQSRVVSRRTADLKHFSDHYFGENVARAVVLNGNTADQIQHFADREQADLIIDRPGPEYSFPHGLFDVRSVFQLLQELVTPPSLRRFAGIRRSFRGELQEQLSPAPCQLNCTRGQARIGQFADFTRKTLNEDGLVDPVHDGEKR